MSTPLLSVEDLKVHFPIGGGLFGAPAGLVKAVDGISFTLKPGETLGVVGESGCGKSTMGRAILRLIEPTGGRVLWLGEALSGLDAKAMRAHRRDMQIIFQDPLAALNPRMTVGEIITEPLRNFMPEMDKAQREQVARDWLARVGLAPEHINRYPHEFSGGQCQRIGIARAMVLKPKLIVCDEPVSALDVSVQGQIVNLLKDLQAEFGLALIFISHNLGIVFHICHRVMVLYLGRMAELAEAEVLEKNPRHPYTQALIAAVPHPDPDAPKPKALVMGEPPSPLNPPSGCAFRTRCPKADATCAADAPPAIDDGTGHLVACHHWQKG